MKVRFGFVSNSSSSSFIIAIKNRKNLSIENAIKKIIDKKFKSRKNFPLEITPDIIARFLSERLDTEMEKEEKMYILNSFFVNGFLTKDEEDFLNKKNVEIYIGNFDGNSHDFLEKIFYTSPKILIKNRNGIFCKED